MKDQALKIKNNVIGTILIAGAAFWVAKKYGKVSNKYALTAIVIIGAVVGANAQSTIKAKQCAKKSAATIK